MCMKDRSDSLDKPKWIFEPMEEYTVIIQEHLQDWFPFRIKLRSLFWLCYPPKSALFFIFFQPVSTTQVTPESFSWGLSMNFIHCSIDSWECLGLNITNASRLTNLILFGWQHEWDEGFEGLIPEIVVQHMCDTMGSWPLEGRHLHPCLFQLFRQFPTLVSQAIAGGRDHEDPVAFQAREVGHQQVGISLQIFSWAGNHLEISGNWDWDRLGRFPPRWPRCVGDN